MELRYVDDRDNDRESGAVVIAGIIADSPLLQRTQRESDEGVRRERASGDSSANHLGRDEVEPT